MSLMSTLAKVAVGVAVAKGVSGMIKAGDRTPPQRDDGLFGHSNAQRAQANAGGGLEGMLGSIMGGQGASSGLGGILESLGGAAGTSGGLNSILGQLSGSAGGGGGGGLGGLLGQLTGGFQAGGGGLGGMLGGLMAGAGATAAASSGGSFGGLLNQAIARQGEPDAQPTADQEALAALMLRAMIQAMKSDGHIDEAEQQRLMGRLGDVSDQERAFVQNEMQKPVDAKGLANDVPDGLQHQVYAMSVMGIDLDSQEEAQYLDQLARAMHLSHDDINEIHSKLGVPTLYT